MENEFRIDSRELSECLKQQIEQIQADDASEKVEEIRKRYPKREGSRISEEAIPKMVEEIRKRNSRRT